MLPEGFDVLEWAKTSRAAQGLTPMVEDEAALERIARIVELGESARVEVAS